MNNSMGGRQDSLAAFSLGVFTSFLTFFVAAIAIQVVDASESIFAVRPLFVYVFIPLMLQSVMVSSYVRGRIEGLFIPLASTTIGTTLFISVMFVPSLPGAEFLRAIYNSIIASLIGGVIGSAFAGARMRKSTAEGMERGAAVPKTCWACGSVVPANAFFCERCGERIR